MDFYDEESDVAEEERKVQMVDKACSPFKMPEPEPNVKRPFAEFAQSEAPKSSKRLK